MAQNYDVVVVGAGAAGVFMAYEFVKLDKNIKFALLIRADLSASVSVL